MSLASELKIEKGVTAIIGSGGKTTMLHALARELSGNGTVILTTSTHMRPSEEFPCLYDPTCDEVKAFLEKKPRHPEERSDEGSAVDHRDEILRCAQDDTQKFPVLCVGAPTDEGKFAACEQVTFSELAELADYVLVEADGSKMLPLKAHAEYEPAIPANTKRTVCVIGASGLNEPIREAVHRPEIFCRMVNASPAEPASPVLVAWLLNYEDFADIYYINQCDLPETKDAAQELASLLCKPAVCGHLL